MPTYEYKCDACGHAFEKFQMMSAEPVKVCPSCGKEQVRRLIGIGAGMIFKGSGFYITDYRDAAYKDKAKADAPPASPSTGDAAKPADAGKSAESSKSGDGSKENKTPAAPAPAPASSTPAAATPASKSAPPAASKSHE